MEHDKRFIIVRPIVRQVKQLLCEWMRGMNSSTLMMLVLSLESVFWNIVSMTNKYRPEHALSYEDTFAAKLTQIRKY